MNAGTRWARLGGAIAAVALLPLTNSSARADTVPGAGVEIVHVEQEADGRLSVLVQVTTAGDASTLSEPVITVDGRPADATVQPLGTGRMDRTTVLALDASRSMAGTPIAEATTAARAFLDDAPEDVRFGLVTFSHRVEVASRATADHTAVDEALDAIRLTGGTRVYDAVVRAATVAGNKGSRSVLLLSDGRDQGSAIGEDTAVRRIEDAGVRVDVVLLGDDAAARARMTRIAAATGGTVVRAATPSALRAVFADAADALAHQQLVTFAPPAGTGPQADLDVSVDLDGKTYRDTASIHLAAATTGAAPVLVRAPLFGGPFLYGAAAALAVGVSLLLAIALGGVRRPGSAQRRVAAYLGEEDAHRGHDLRASAASVTDTVTRAVGTDFETRLARRLSAAGLGMTAAEWLLLQAGVAVLCAAIGFVVAGVVGLVVFLLLGAAGPTIYLNHRRSRRVRAFHDLLPETLTLISGGLSAGLSVAQAVDTVVREGREPVASELRRALVEHRLGVNLEDTLDAVAERMESGDFAWVVMAIRIQREVGGNLAEVLTTVAETLRERAYLARQVRTLSAEGRLSAWILGGLPVAMFVYFLVANRKFVHPLYSEALGWLLLGVASMLLAAGVWTMSRMVKVEV